MIVTTVFFLDKQDQLWTKIAPPGTVMIENLQSHKRKKSILSLAKSLNN